MSESGKVTLIDDELHGFIIRCTKVYEGGFVPGLAENGR